MVGVELRDRDVTAVVVDMQGGVRARADAAFGADAVAALYGVLDTVAGALGGAETVGVATAAAESQSTAELVEALGRRHVGPFLQDGPTPAGTAAAVAEAWVGAARDARDVVYFAVDEHPTAGIVRDGRAWLGARHRASSVAWLALNPVEREDYRKSGCLEAEVAAAGIVRRLVWRIKAGDRSRIEDVVGGDLAAITLTHVLDAARERDGVSISVVRDTAKYLGMAAANLVAVADPEVLVLGGIMASAADLVLEPVSMEIARRLPKPMMEALRVVTASLGRDAAAIGAARLAGAAVP